MSHIALARKHRPRRFSEVATQEHVSETLRRAVAVGRVGHAYLFCGPRGVGKTTLARVLAMALNCADRSDDGEPCGVCGDCTRIWSGTTSLDVVEIDAATNRGVDDARELRTRAMYAPSEEARYKVYIVDEAHMLTREAWNALLKILEEPPPRVIFIFATTEPQKIEQTAAPIMSRCQRFDFRRVGVPEIVERLREVLTREDAQASDEALRMLARRADGGMRDALSLTDQLLALGDGTVTVEAARRVLGVVEDERFLALFDLLAEGDRAGLFGLVEELLDGGYDLVEFYHGMVEAMRTLLRLRVGGGVSELPDEQLAEWQARADRFAPADLIRMLGMASELETTGSLRRTNRPRVLLELLLLRLSYLDRTVDVESLLRALGGEGDPVTPDASAERGGSGGREAPARRRAPRAGAASTGPELREEAGSTGPSAGPNVPDTRGEADAPESRAGSDSQVPAPVPPPDRHADPLAGWRALLESGEGVPGGLGPFLVGADVRATDDALFISLAAGPAREKLGDPGVRGRLEEALARHLDRAVEIRLEEGAGATSSDAARVSEDEVRRGRMDDLLAREPLLRAAVEELDLEILD